MRRFTLTPALSLREREFVIAGCALHTLVSPEGEGDWGKRHVQATIRTPLIMIIECIWGRDIPCPK